LAFSLLDDLHKEPPVISRSADTKRLVEEIVPIATLAKFLEGPECHLSLTYVADHENFDALVDVAGALVDTGHCEPRYYLEVTSAVAPHEYLQREALARNGLYFGGPDIRRLGSRRRGTAQVESKLSVRHSAADATAACEWVKTAIAAKASGDYPSPCLLLIRVEPESHLTTYEWLGIVESSHLSAASSDFSAVYLVNTSTGATFEV